MSYLPINDVIRLTNAKKKGPHWLGHCPSPNHNDKKPSLSITEISDGKAMVYCHSMCASKPPYFALLNKLGITKKQKEYVYKSPDGESKLKVTRVENSKNKTKDFYQANHNDGEWKRGGYKGELTPLYYHLWKDKPEVYLVEGEKCANVLMKIGLPATTTPMGAQKWDSKFNQYFSNKKVICLADNDEAGKKFINLAIASISVHADSVLTLNLPNLIEKEDVFDWLAKGNTKDDLIKLIDSEAEVIIGPNKIETPLPLYRELKEPTPYPIEALGEVIGPAVDQISFNLKSDPALAAQSVLAAVTLCTQGHFNITMDGRTIPLSLFLLTIAKSGERKSANDHFAMLAVNKYQSELNKQFRIDMSHYNTSLEIYHTALKKQLAKKTTKESIKKVYDDLGPEPTQPLHPMLITAEPTFEGMIKCIQHGQPSMGIISDEGGRLVGGHAFSKDQLLKSITGFCELYGAKPISKTRAGEGSQLIYGKRVCMHLMLQPKVSNLVLSNPIITDQGFLNRFLISYPNSTIGSRNYVNQSLTENPIMKTYWKRCTELLQRKKQLVEGTANVLDPRVIKVSDTAKAMWIEHYNKIEHQQLKGNLLFEITGFASKAGEHTLRLAACLAAFQNNEAEISDKIMKNAITLCEYYIGEFKRIYDSALIDPDIHEADKLLSWIKEKEKKYIYLSEVYQFGPASIREAKKASRIINILVKHHWLIRCTEQVKINGINRKKAWMVRYE